MIISTKGRYALRVMIDLAEHQTGAYIPLKEIAERQEISEKYLEAILKVLVRERFLIGMRGKGGGYKLSRAPEHHPADRGQSGPGGLPGGARGAVSPGGAVPHTAHVEGV